MSNFSLLSTDVGLWNTSTKATWGSLDFCPAVMWFQVYIISQTQLTTLSQAGAWGDTEKPRWDMALGLIVPSLAIGCQWVFGLTAMWVHPQQTHLHTLGEVAHKLILLANKGPNWPYAYVQMNDAMAHAPVSSEGYIGIMTDGMPSTNACGHLDQLQVWKLLQCGNWVVCPEGINGGLKALLFDFKELPLWNVASGDESTWDLPLIEVNLNGTEPEATNTTPVIPFFPAVKPPCGIAVAINLHLQGPLNGCSCLPPQAQPPSLSIAHLEGSCHLEPWGLHPPPE